MKIKKVIAVIAGIAVALSAAVGGVYGYKSYQDKKLVAEVQPVSSLNWGYWGDTETSYGTVTNDSSQEIYLDDSRMIKEVYVEKGDEVQKGDPLLAYDTAELQIEIERKKLDISTIENNIERQKYKYVKDADAGEERSAEAERGAACLVSAHGRGKPPDRDG